VKRLLVLVPLLALSACQGQPVKMTNRGVLHVSVDGDSQAPALDVTHDVGSVMVGLRKEIVVRATNVGVDTMHVLGVSLGTAGNGSWFVRDVTGTLAPDASLTATVTFAPAGQGAQTTQVTFSHDADAAFPRVQLTGNGS
jgi:hypothetical protein